VAVTFKEKLWENRYSSVTINKFCRSVISPPPYQQSPQNYFACFLVTALKIWLGLRPGAHN